MQLNTLGIVHEFIKQNVHEGAFCIDATAGKGRDTALLCELAGLSGKVIAFDIQEEAVTQTRKLLEDRKLKADVYLDSHENMALYAEDNSVDCIVFNFGRLPGGDVNIFTHADSSIKAIDTGLNLLKSKGIMVIALYYGGFNGYDEKNAILEHIKYLDDKKYSVLCCEWSNRKNDPPMPVFIWKD